MFCPVVTTMVTKRERSGQLQPLVLQCGKKSIGIGNTRTGNASFSRKYAKGRKRSTRQGNDSRQSMRRAADRNTGYFGICRCRVASGIDDQIRPADRRKRFAEETGRKCPAVAERPSCIQEQDIEITLEPEVLVAIIQENNIRLEPFKRLQPGSIAIGSSYDNKTGNGARKEHGLITCLSRREKNPRTVGNNTDLTASCASVPPGQDDNTFAPGNQQSCYQDCHRSFARPPDRKVSDGNDRCSQAKGSKNSLAIQKDPQPQNEAVDDRPGQQQGDKQPVA